MKPRDCFRTVSFHGESENSPKREKCNTAFFCVKMASCVKNQLCLNCSLLKFGYDSMSEFGDMF